MKKIAVLCGLAGPIVVFTLIFYAISLAPWFRWTENALSDLGVDEKAGFPFNLALILGGSLYAVFAVVFGAALPKSVLSRISLCLMLLDAVALCAIGVFPENIKPWHFYASVAFFVLIPLSQFPVGVILFNEKNWKLGLLTVLLGIVTATVWVYPWKAVAIPEAVTGGMLAIWIAALSLWMYRQSD